MHKLTLFISVSYEFIVFYEPLCDFASYHGVLETHVDWALTIWWMLFMVSRIDSECVRKNYGICHHYLANEYVQVGAIKLSFNCFISFWYHISDLFEIYKDVFGFVQISWVILSVLSYLSLD